MNAIPPPSQWLLVAAAKGLQGYVLRSDPLKEMIGASELVEALPRTGGTGFLARALPSLDLQHPYRVLTDASGAVRILFDAESDAKRLALLWPVLAGQFAPGLEVSVALVEVESGHLGAAIEHAERQINENRNQPAAAHPEAGPWVARNRRTGLPAAQLVSALDEEERAAKQREALDDESARKRQAAEWTSAQTLLEKVVPDEHRQLLALSTASERRQFKKRWPLDLTKLATSDNSYLAIIHADANGLGLAMMACTDQLKHSPQPAETYKALCQAIEDASKAAAQAATKRVIATTLKEEQSTRKATGRACTLPIPVRPIVCAGEDLTCVVRARDALRFVEDYLVALEKETEQRFKPKTTGGDLPEAVKGLKPLTACAGVVFCKSHFPFSRAYALAEKLCGFAKKETQRNASAVAFLRYKSSLQPSEDYEEVVAHAFQAGRDPDRVSLTMNPYLVGGHTVGGLPKLADLRLLVKALASDKLPNSGLRGLVSRAYESKAAAEDAFERLRLVVEERDKNAWKSLHDALVPLTGGQLWKMVNKAPPDNPTALTPLYDALELLHLNVEFGDDAP